MGEPDEPIDESRGETSNQRADRNWNDLLQEVRITQTCTQILGGFLLAVAFQPRFTELDGYQTALYLTLVTLAGIATALALALVMLHRKYFGERKKPRIVLTGSRILSVNLVIVAVLIAGVTSLVFDLAVSRTAGVIALAMGLLVGLSLWAFVPLASRDEQA